MSRLVLRKTGASENIQLDRLTGFPYGLAKAGDTSISKVSPAIIQDICDPLHFPSPLFIFTHPETLVLR